MMRPFFRSIVAAFVLFAAADRSAAQPPAAAECPGLHRKCVQQKWDALHANATPQLPIRRAESDVRDPKATEDDWSKLIIGE